MKYSININHDLRIIIYRHSGSILEEDIGSAWDEFMNMVEFTSLGYNLLSDYRNGQFEISIDRIQAITEILSKLKPILKGKKQALIVDDPYSVAGSMLFEANVYKEVGFIVKPFSTEAAALKWLAQ
jgi:hypothetical protein